MDMFDDVKTSKRCKICRKVKEKYSFPPMERKTSRLGLSAICKDCQGVDISPMKEKLRAYKFMRLYGITLEFFNELNRKQNGLCKICGLPDTDKANLSVDHCHASKKIRGLLCTNCNQGLGKFKESVSLMKKAIEYIEKSEEAS